jgi:DNA-binding SARP family transcriptional activator
MSHLIDFGILGPVAVRCDGELLNISGKRQQALLATLLLSPGQTVSSDRLITAIWGEEPPATARGQLRICVSELRRVLARHDCGELIKTSPQGYRIQVPPGALDVGRFEEHAALGRQLARAGDAWPAVDHLRRALAEWRGPLSATLSNADATRLAEERSAVFEELVQLRIDLGQHREVLGELAQYVAEFPYRDSLRAQQMLALFRSGRPTEALDLYRRTRRQYIDELGIEPGPELRRIQRYILGRDDEPEPTALDHRLQVLEREIREMRIGLARLQDRITAE